MRINKHLLKIDVSNSKYGINDDLVTIKFKNEDDLQFNFSKLFIQSKYIRNKYIYSDALNLIQAEINKIESELNINAKSIKLFIQLIQDEKADIPIEHYKDLYTLSEYFCIPKFTVELDKISQNQLFKDLDFTIQILLDSEKSNESIETKLTSNIENFLSERINECIENVNFSKLPVSTVYRIIDRADKERINQNSLFNFILESTKTHFALFKFVELQKMTDENVEKFINFIEKQDNELRKVILEYLPFNFSFIKDIKYKYDKLFKELSQTKEELSKANEKFNQTKKDLNQTKEKLSKTKEELNQTKKDLNQVKDELMKTKDELIKTQKIPHIQKIIICGDDEYNQLGEKPNNSTHIISPPISMPLDLSILLSYSVYRCHAVLITKNGLLMGIGNNKDGRIASTLPKKRIDHFTEFSIKDEEGNKLVPISAVCCEIGTLYMLCKNSDERQLVLCDKDINGGSPVFLKIGNHQPVAIFGGEYNAAAIGTEGEVIFINRFSVQNSPESLIEAVSLPEGEKASSVACCRETLFVLSSKGRVFASHVEKRSNTLNFSVVLELSGKEIVSVSGTCQHCLAVSKEGHVFGRGENGHGELGLGKEKTSSSTFTEILSLQKHRIRAAYAGDWHSLFETQEGKILACGYNEYGQLLLKSGTDRIVFSPTETTITSGSVFCIAGVYLSAVFIGNCPLPNLPNMRIQQNQ